MGKKVTNIITKNLEYLPIKMNLKKFNVKIIILISVYFLSITINAKTINIVTITQDFSSIAKEWIEGFFKIHSNKEPSWAKFLVNKRPVKADGSAKIVYLAIGSYPSKPEVPELITVSGVFKVFATISEKG